VTDLQNAQKMIELDRMSDRVDEIEGKAVTQRQQLEVLELRIDQLHARIILAAAELTGGIEGKSAAGMSREKRRTLRKVVEDIGGFAPSGYAADLLDYDDWHFDRAVMLVRGEVEPESDDEAKALERWRAKHGPHD